jgi:hypothetical protein
VAPTIEENNGLVFVHTHVPTIFGGIRKCWSIDDEKGSVALSYDIDWPQAPIGSLRLGFVTLNPTAFDYKSLTVQTTNGGVVAETFPVYKKTVDHGAPVSFLVSASQALSASTGVCQIGDCERSIELIVNKQASAAVAMLRSEPVKDSFFSRLYFSILEQDDTSRARCGLQEHFELSIRALKH